jgi:hypothetical protein
LIGTFLFLGFFSDEGAAFSIDFAHGRFREGGGLTNDGSASK